MNNISRFIAAASITLLASLAQAESPAPGSDRAQGAVQSSMSGMESTSTMGAQGSASWEKYERVTNGGTGFVGLTHSNVSSKELRDEAAAAVRAGTISHGEM